MMSYNVLADGLVKEHKRELYPGMPDALLDWNARLVKIVAEVEHLRPDVLTLQEVDRFEDFKRHLRRLGYEGCFLSRSGNKKDGCATFWSMKRARVLQKQFLKFRKKGLKDNVAILMVIELESKVKLVVGNIHVLFNPSRGDIKLGQLVSLFHSLEKLKKNNHASGIVIGGDFNLGPSSALYDFIVQGILDCTIHDRRHLSGQLIGQQQAKQLGLSPPDDETATTDNPQLQWTAAFFCTHSQSHKPQAPTRSLLELGWDEERLLIATGQTPPLAERLVTHTLQLRSAYASIAGEPVYTSLHNRFMGTLDYIFYTDFLQVKRVLSVPDLRFVCPKHVRRPMLPSRHFPSDHISLVVDFCPPTQEKPPSH